MPATAWTEMAGALPGWQDRIPAVMPPVQVLAQTAYVLMDMVPIPNTTYIAILPGDDTWSKPGVTATSYTEGSVASTAWTEVSG